MSPGHTHDQDQGDGFDWWPVADLVVWAAVVVLFVVGTEWLAGAIVREQIDRGFRKILKQAAPAPQE